MTSLTLPPEYLNKISQPTFNRSHQIQLNQTQIKFIVDCIKFAAENNTELKATADEFGDAHSEYLPELFTDLLDLPAEEYEYDTLHGFCI